MTSKSPNPLGLYIHIPFCHARCGYCDFVTFTGKEDQRDKYVDALIKEVALYAPSSGLISTIFFGGGTPSVLDPKHLQVLFQALHRHFQIDPSVEISLEANPESVTPEKCAAWREVGINRLSLGLQAYDDVLLKAMGRLHNVQQFEVAYDLARSSGFDNLSIDLMYGFPNQTFKGWEETLASTVALHPEHISLYALKVEEHTPFGVDKIQVNDELQADMYAAALAQLPQSGYTQYEISNFSQPNRECRHNLIYWRAQDYLGLGVGAVGCINGLRWENHKNFHPYYRDLDAGRYPRAQEEALEEKVQKFERLMLGLRLREGLSWSESDQKWVEQRAKLAHQGYLEEIRPGVWRIPQPYVALTNQILLPFLPAA